MALEPDGLVREKLPQQHHHTQQCERDGNPSPLYRGRPHEAGSAMSLRARRVRMKGRSITESGASMPFAERGYGGVMLQSAAAPRTPISPGETEISLSVSIIYRIE